MFSLLSDLFKSEGVVKKAVDGVYNGVDKVIFTDEEKAEYFLRLLEAYHPFKLAQRFLALLFVVPYVLSFLVAFFTFVFGLFLRSSHITDVSLEILEFTNNYLGVPVSVIVAFYFAGGALNSLRRRINEGNS